MNNDLKAVNLTWLSKTSLTNLNAGEGETNLVDVKKYRSQKVEYPYVSGQAMRFYLRESIRRTLGKDVTMCVPDEKGETCGDAKKCLNCDLFGFMRTIKKSEKTAGGATRRVSPVKVAPAMGLLPFDENTVLDFLTRRHQKEKGELEGDIANVEIGTNIYRCGAAIDIRRVGAEENWETGHSVEIKDFVDAKTKLERIRKVIDGIRFISDYSKQARLLTDFTPDVLCIAFQSRYSHRLQKLFELDKDLNLEPQRVREILADVTGYSDKVFFGLISGLIKNEDEIVKVFKEFEIEKQRPDQVFEAALKELA